MSSKPETSNRKRPISITIICLIDFINIPSGILFFSSSFFGELLAKFDGDSSFVPLANTWLVATLIVSIFLWRMNKWAAYTYIAILIFNKMGMSMSELDFDDLMGLVLRIYFILKNVSKMS